ncbi:hypothetical protein CBR_g55305 [Chara braunii]|uniref:Uncharacterized protein n=1 Tax=Chara braunii TaxID=69332 RepID=A0A388MCV6_CHABU|nr:hypothetical protein CBR_g55305 [Chara braunii]|eukprot:GBG92398.1 hypothetical protein CBR_g55305 [Chara braunii]
MKLDERICSKTAKNKDVLKLVKSLLGEQDALAFAEHVISFEKLPPEERALLQIERQEHFQQLNVERAMASAAPTSKQVAYLRSLGCTAEPATKLEASELIGRYKNM